MNKTWSIVKWFLIAWGAVCAIGAVILGGVLAYSLGSGNRETTGCTDKPDVRFVLNWCGLGDERIEEVVHSSRSARSFTGDHLDAYAIKISRVDPTELTRDTFGSGWFRCDQTEGVIKDAIELVCGSLHEDAISWFPREDELKSPDMYVYSWSIYCHGTQPTAVELIFVRPRDKMMFFMSIKT